MFSWLPQLAAVEASGLYNELSGESRMLAAHRGAGETIMTWTNPETREDIALSFQARPATCTHNQRTPAPARNRPSRARNATARCSCADGACCTGGGGSTGGGGCTAGAGIFRADSR